MGGAVGAQLALTNHLLIPARYSSYLMTVNFGIRIQIRNGVWGIYSGSSHRKDSCRNELRGNKCVNLIGLLI